MKNKKLVVSVLSTALVSSMAASALAAPSAGLYVGGDVDKFYSIDSFLSDTNNEDAVLEVMDAGFENVLYVDEDGNVATLDEMADADDISDVLHEATKADFEKEPYTQIDEDGSELGTYNAQTDADLPGDIVTPGELKVESVSAINAKQVEIKFNKEVDATSAEDLTNYNVYLQGALATDVSDNAGASAKLQSDKKTVILTLETTGGAFTNDTTGNVVEVATSLKAVDGSVLAAKYTKADVAFTDGTLPSLMSAEQIASNQVKLVFNEPVRDEDGNLTFDGNEVAIDNGAIPVSSITADVDDRALIVQTYATLTNGEHTVKLQSGAVEDFVSYVNLQQTKTFTAQGDTTVPTVTVKSATPDKVTLNFSKPVKFDPSTGAADNIAFRAVYNNTGNQLLGNASIARILKADGTQYDGSLVSELALDFPSDLPPGSVDVYIEYVSTTNTTNVIKDGYGNTLPEQKVVANTTIDTVKPTVAKVERTSSTTVDITFSEAVEATSANLSTNYTITTSTGANVAVNSAQLQADNKTVRLTTANLSGGTYTIKAKNVKDRAVPTANTMDEYTTTFTAPDASNPTVLSAQYVDGNGVTTKDKVVVKFSEAMATSGAGSIADKLNYYYSTNNRSSYNSLGANDSVQVSADGKTATITLASNVAWDATPSNNDIKFGPVTDAAGNRLISNTTIGHEMNLSAAAVGVLSAEFTDVNKVKVVFDSVLTTVDASEFALANDSSGTGLGYTLSVFSHTVEEGKSVVVFESNTAVGYDGKVSGPANVAFVTAGTTNTKTVDGLTVGALAYDGTFADADATPNQIVDKVAPALATTNPVITVDADNDGYIDHIQVEFQEAVSDATLNLNSFTVAGYTVSSVFADADTTPGSRANGKYVFIQVEEKTSGAGDTGVTPTVTRVGTVKDVAGNEFTGLTAGVTAADKAKPVMKSVELGEGTTAAAGIDSDDTITFTFSEAIDTTTLGGVVMTTAGTLADDTGTFATFATGGDKTVATLGKAWGNGNTVLTLTTSGTLGGTTAASGTVTLNTGAGVTDVNGNAVNTTTTATPSGSFTPAS